jgi:hypothetical protein
LGQRWWLCRMESWVRHRHLVVSSCRILLGLSLQTLGLRSSPNGIDFLFDQGFSSYSSPLVEIMKRRWKLFFIIELYSSCHESWIKNSRSSPGIFKWRRFQYFVSSIYGKLGVFIRYTKKSTRGGCFFQKKPTAGFKNL